MARGGKRHGHNRRPRRGSAEWWADRQRARQTQEAIDDQLIPVFPIAENGIVQAIQHAHNALANAGGMIVEGVMAGLQAALTDVAIRSLPGLQRLLADIPEEPELSPDRTLRDLARLHLRSLIALRGTVGEAIQTSDAFQRRMIAGSAGQRDIASELVTFSTLLRNKQVALDAQIAKLSLMPEHDYNRRITIEPLPYETGTTVRSWRVRWDDVGIGRVRGAVGPVPGDHYVAVPSAIMQCLVAYREEGVVDLRNVRAVIEHATAHGDRAFAAWVARETQVYLIGLTTGFRSDDSQVFDGLSDWDYMELGDKSDERTNIPRITDPPGS